MLARLLLCAAFIGSVCGESPAASVKMTYDVADAVSADGGAVHQPDPKAVRASARIPRDDLREPELSQYFYRVARRRVGQVMREEAHRLLADHKGLKTGVDINCVTFDEYGNRVVQGRDQSQLTGLRKRVFNSLKEGFLKDQKMGNAQLEKTIDTVADALADESATNKHATLLQSEALSLRKVAYSDEMHDSDGLTVPLLKASSKEKAQQEVTEKATALSDALTEDEMRVALEQHKQREAAFNAGLELPPTLASSL